MRSSAMRSRSAVVAPSRQLSRSSISISATILLAPFMISISRALFKWIIHTHFIKVHAIIRRDLYIERKWMAETKLNGKTVLMVIPHTQFRDEEFFEPKKILENEGAKVVVASTSARTCYGMNGGSISSEVAIADAKADQYHALVVCGGSSVPEFFWNDKKLQELVTAFSSAGKVVAAICLSTVVLAK